MTFFARFASTPTLIAPLRRTPSSLPVSRVSFGFGGFGGGFGFAAAAVTGTATTSAISAAAT